MINSFRYKLVVLVVIVAAVVVVVVLLVVVSVAVKHNFLSVVTSSGCNDEGCEFPIRAPKK